MADKTEFDSRPTQIPKDVQGSDNAIPLSPQWLQSKPGDTKTGPFTGENHFSPLPSNANRPVYVKPTGTGDELIDNSKKKDVFRPSVLDMESGRRDRWRDEERDMNSSARKDRWREGEREHVDNNRRVDRPQRLDSSGRHYGETRAPGERWNDSGNKDNNRESKWNSRWGNDEKEADAVREKWGGSNKKDDVLLDKGTAQVPSHGKDERDADHYRPWRPTSSYSRGRSDPHQILTLDRQVPTFSHGRGRGENPAPVYSHGRARARSGGNLVTHAANHLQPHGPLIEKSESGYGELGPLSYSRTKMTDIYRTTDMMSFYKYAEGFVQVPSLTQEEPIEPLSFCAPTPEELVIQKGIDKGEVIGSGAPQVSKDGSAGRTTTDLMQSRRSRIGTAPDDSKHDTLDNSDGYSEGPIQDKHSNRWTNAEALKDDTAFHRKSDDISAARGSITPGTWRSSFAERSRLTSDRRELTMDIPKDLNNVWQNSMTDSPNTKKGAPKWQVGEDSVMRRQPPAAMNRDVETPITSHPSPEDLVLYYKDPQGEIQGPFSGSDIITWFESGYFGIDLNVRLAGAPADSPFSLLGDVMPHLRAKARPPPGFKSPKADETKDTPGIPSFTSSGKLHAVASESDVLKSDPRYQHGIGSATEAENRYIESLMGGGLSNVPFDKFAFSEGMQGYGGTNFIARSRLGSSSRDDPYLLAKKLALERQKSIPNPYPLWPGRDAPSVTTNTDVINEASLARAQHHPQTVESSPVNGISSWMNFPPQGGLEPLHDKLDVRQTQNVPPQSALGIMLQRLQLQNPSLSNLLAQSLDNTSRIPAPEQILASGIPQDQQILSLLQQQYLLQQVQSQPPVASQQLTLLDMMLKQQQKQEEQQQLMRQQQQLLSQVLSEHHHNQPLGDVPFSQLQAGFSGGNANVDHARFQQHRDIFQMGPQVQAATGMRDENENASDLALPPRDSQDINRSIGSENSEVLMHLPHQMYANTPKQRNWDASSPEQIAELTKHLSGTPDGKETISKYDASRVSTTDIASGFSAREQFGEADPHQQFTPNLKNEAQFHETVEALAETPAGALVEPRDMEDQHIVDSAVKEVKKPEAREVTKASEKKSRKQKSSKSSTEPLRGASKSQQLKSSESEGTIIGNAKSETLAASVKENEKINIKKVAGDAASPPGQSSLPAVNYTVDVVTMYTNDKPGQISHTPQVSIEANTVQRAWKPAPGFKPKSFLEIQQEEQRRAQEEERRAQEAAVSDISTSLNSVSVSTPWAGIVVNADHKSLEENRQEAASIGTNFTKSVSSSNLKKKNIQNEDLFWGSSVDKISDREVESSNSVAPLTSIMSSHTDSVVEDDFIEAKESKKSRKKSAKAKNAGAKATSVAAAADVFVGSSTNDKGKYTRQVQQQKEVLPALPSGPSLGDFVPWKGEPASPPAPAWFDSGKPKAASLRDILKEQGKKVSSPLPVPAPQKPVTNQPARGSGPSWSYSSSPAKAASPMKINSQTSSQPKHKVEDDLFWGPLEQPKSEDTQLEFPQLSTHGSWGSKSTPVKGNTGGTINQQKSTGNKPADYSLPKGKKNAMTKNSEAADFKEWCESECFRLMGSKDTSILEYCLKISRSEAETLLIENLGSFDRNHEFIDKFLSYKDFLPADVVEIAFKNHNDWKTTASGAGDMIFDHAHFASSNPGSAGGYIDEPTKVGKKKGKKGKKISASVLGFNVVSSRIMKGEIQTVDE